MKQEDVTFIQDVTSELCSHPEIITLPVTLDRLYAIMCCSCGKTVSITYSDFFNGRACIVTIVEEEFGHTWAQEAAKWCRCERHKSIGG